MGSSDNAGIETTPGQLLCDIDLRGRTLTDEQEARFVNAIAGALKGLAEATAGEDESVEVEVFRSGRIWRSDGAPALPRRAFWSALVYVGKK